VPDSRPTPTPTPMPTPMHAPPTMAPPVRPESLRVAQVANYVGPQSGGLRVVVEELGAAQVRAGRSRLLVLPSAADTCTGDERDRRVTVASPVLPGSRGRYRVLIRRQAVIQALEAFGPDVAEIHDQTTLSWIADWARGNGVRSVLFCHERLDLVLAEAAGLPGDWFAGPGRHWSARLARSVDAVVCASDFAAEPFAGKDLPRPHVIPFGVDLAAFTPSAGQRSRRAFWGLPDPSGDAGGADDAWRLVFAGRLHPEKGAGTALDVLARLRAEGHPARLVIAGSGPLERSLRQRVARERLPVRFLGHVSGRSELAALLADADAALSPGPRETFGLSVLETMACGTPVVVSSRGASRELLAPGTGGCGADAAELAEIVLGLLRDPETLAASRVAARARAELFPWSATAAALEPIAYAPATSGGPAPRERWRVQNR
jgi:alpha-1,6-mannosyltransferase